MENLNKQSGLIAILVLVIIIGLGYFYINPTVEDLRANKIKTEATKIEVKDLNEKKTALLSLETKMKNEVDKVNKLGLALPSNENIPELLTSIENIASKNSLRVNSVQPSKDSVNKEVVSLVVSLQGNYIGLKNFISDLEGNIRAANIKEVNIVSSDSNLNFTINIQFIKSTVN